MVVPFLWASGSILPVALSKEQKFKTNWLLQKIEMFFNENIFSLIFLFNSAITHGGLHNDRSKVSNLFLWTSLIDKANCHKTHSKLCPICQNVWFSVQFQKWIVFIKWIQPIKTVHKTVINLKENPLRFSSCSFSKICTLINFHEVLWFENCRKTKLSTDTFVKMTKLMEQN